MNRKLKAILLNALVLPGLGQLYFGRKVMGFAIVMVINLLLLFALFICLKGLSPVIAAQMTSGAVNAAEVLKALNSVAGLGKGFLAAFILVWVFALFDLLKNKEES